MTESSTCGSRLRISTSHGSGIRPLLHVMVLSLRFDCSQSGCKKTAAIVTNQVVGISESNVGVSLNRIKKELAASVNNSHD